MLDKVLLAKITALSVASAVGMGYIALQPRMSDYQKSASSSGEFGAALTKNLKRRQKSQMDTVSLLGDNGRYDEVYIGKK